MVWHQSAIVHRGAVVPALHARGRPCSNGATLAKTARCASHGSFNPLRMRQIPGTTSFYHHERRLDRSYKALRIQPRAQQEPDWKPQANRPNSESTRDSWLRGLAGALIVIPGMLYAWHSPPKVHAAELKGLADVRIAEDYSAKKPYKFSTRECYSVAEAAAPAAQLKEFLQSDKARIAGTILDGCSMEDCPTDDGVSSTSIGVLALVAFIATRKGPAAKENAPVNKTDRPIAPPAAATKDDDDVFSAIHDPVERQRLQRLQAERQGVKGASAQPAAPARQSVADMFRDISGGGELGVYRSPPPPGFQNVDESAFAIIDDPVERARLRDAAAARGKISRPKDGSIDLSFIADPVERQKLADRITGRGGKVMGVGAPGAPSTGESDIFSVIEDPVERKRLREKAAAASKLTKSAAELSERLAPEVAEVTRSPKSVPKNTEELHDAVAVSSGTVVDEEIDLSFIPDPFERENLRQRIAARKAAAGIPAAAPKGIEGKAAAAAELAASAAALTERLAPEVAAITSSTDGVDGSAFDAISDPVERAAAIEKAKASGRYLAPARPSGATRSIPPGSTLAISPPGSKMSESSSKLTANAIPPPPPPKRKKWWKKLKNWRVAVSRKDAMEAAMKSTMDVAPTAHLTFDQGTGGLSLKAASPPTATMKSRQSFFQSWRQGSGKTPSAVPTQSTESPTETPSARSIALGFFSVKSSKSPGSSPPATPPESPKAPAAPSAPAPVAKAQAAAPVEKVEPSAAPAAPAAPQAVSPTSAAEAKPAVQEAKKKFDAAAFFLQQSIDMARANRPVTVYEPADVSRPLPETPVLPVVPPVVQASTSPTLVAGPGPIVPKASAPPPPAAAAPAPAVTSGYTTNAGPVRPVGTPETSGPAPPKPEASFVTTGPILPVGAAEKPIAEKPPPQVKLVSGPGPILPVPDPSAPAELPPAYVATKPSLSSANGPIVPVAPVPERSAFVKPQSLYNLQGPIVPAAAPAAERAAAPPPTPQPSMVSGPGPISPARAQKELPPLWPKPPVKALIVSGPGPLVAAERPTPKVEIGTKMLDGANASLAAGPGPIVPSVVRKMMNVFDLSPKFSQWAPSFEAGKASWGERPLLPMKPAGVARTTGFGKASWAADRGSPGERLPGTKMPGFPAEGTKATIYVGPGPLVPVEVTSDGTEIAKMGVPEGAKEVVAKSIKKDSNDDDKNGPSAPPPSASSGVSAGSSASGPAVPVPLKAETGPVGGLESGWLVNLVMGNRRYIDVPVPAQTAVAAVAAPQDGSSPYLAKSDAALNSGSTLRMGVSNAFKGSGSSTSLEIPGAKAATAALQGVPMGIAPEGGAIPRGAPSPVRRGPADLPAFIKTAPGTPPPPGAVRVSAPPVPMDRSLGRMDPAAYVSSSEATVDLQTRLPPEPLSGSDVTSFPLGDLSDDEDAPVPARKRNGASPVLTALGLFAAAAEAVSPLWKGKGQGRTASAQRSSREPGDYDLFAELLTSIANDQKLKGGEEWSAVRWLTDLVPEKGVQKFDVLRQLMRHLVEMPPASKTPSKYDMVWDLLYKSRETGGAGASPRYDPVYDLLTNAALAADWGLPEKDPIRDLLHIRDNDWETSKYDPVAAFFNSGAGWHNNVKPKWDPVPALLAVEPPTGQAWFDPVADILGRVKGTLPARREKQMAPATPAVLSQRPTAIRSPTASPSDSNGQLPEEKPIVVERSPGGSIAVAAPPVPVGTLAAATSQARSSPPAPAPTAAASPSFLSAARDYDPIPDLIRMQGVVGGPNPAPYDPLVVIVRRGGGVEFMDAARSFRDLLDDEQLSRKYNGVFSVLQEPRNAHLGAPASVLARIPAPGTEKNPIESALGSVEGLMSDMMDRYPKLYRLLQGRARETVVDALCALAALVRARPNMSPSPA